MPHGSLPGRFLRHLATDHGSVRRAFPDAALARIEALVGEGEKGHRGQVRFAVEPALALARVLSRVTPRERALEVFGLLRVWDTEENCGILVYLLLADRAVEIVADRGIHRRVGDAAWEAVCRKMEAAFRGGRFAEGVEAGLAEVNALLAEHYPREGGGAGNELPDRPVVL
ncbi:MAG TPA: TPM domain-containing protein [Casimicrobiaceae bacterium]|nr:TPM domain-containing protein [Casimicrobiaceae bacterium]